MKRIFIFSALVVASFVSLSCNKMPDEPQEEKIAQVTNYVIVRGDEDLLKFFDVTLNYKCGNETKSSILNMDDMLYEYSGGSDNPQDVIIGLGTNGRHGRYSIIPIRVDWTKPYELSVSIDAKLKDVSEFPAPGQYEINSNITGLYVQGVTNMGFCGQGTIWFPGGFANAEYSFTLEDSEKSRQDVYSDLEYFKDNFKHSSFGVNVTVKGKELVGVPIYY